MKIKLKNSIILFSLFALLTAGLYVGAVVKNKITNNQVYSINFESNNLFLQSDKDKILRIEQVNEGEAWENSACSIDSKTGDNNFYAMQYKFIISNDSSTAINYYNLRVEFPEECYLLKMWTGNYEAHQMRNGEELIQNIDGTQTEYTLDTAIHDKDVLIHFLPGDYLIYYPGTKGWEIPLQVKGNAYPGFIVFQPIENDNLTFGIKSIFPSNYVEKDEEVKATITSRNEIYGKLDEESIPSYVMDTYDIDIKNNAKYDISNFNYRFDIKQTMYLNSIWTGSIEIHQFRGTEEKIQSFNDGRKFKQMDISNELLLESTVIDNEFLIVLNPGDYFIYTPTSDEANIKTDKSTESGIIIIYENGLSHPDITMKVEYKLVKPLLSSPLFIACMVLFFVLVATLIFEIVLLINIRKYKIQSEHDEKIIEESIETFIEFIDAKDPYTNGHSKRVAQYTKQIAAQLGYEHNELKRFYYIALMHDCGKIGIPDSILSKPGKLTDEEFDIIKSHTRIGYEILKNFTSIEGIRDGALYHHERYDGKGYPTGKKGEDIPLIGRIICVADSYDAMNSDRCYRKRLDKDVILKELESNKGTQFDPKIVDVFIKILKENKN